MFESIKIKRRLALDGLFGALLLFFYIVFRLKFSAKIAEMNRLFLASYIFLLLGVFLFYLTYDMNAELASALHMSIFPVSSASFMFTKWAPIIQNGATNSRYTFYYALISYNLLLISYFVLQYFRHRENPEP